MASAKSISSQGDAKTDQDSDSVLDRGSKAAAVNKSVEFGSEADYSKENSKSTDFSVRSSDNIYNNKRKKKNRRKSHSAIGEMETKLVRRSKYAVLTLMVVACTACAAAVYLVSCSAQDRAFAEEFENFGSEIISVSSIHTRNMIAVIWNMGLTITSFAQDSPTRDFPFVTIPHFEHRAAQVLEMTGANYIAWNVLLLSNTSNSTTSTTTQAWNNYSMSNQEWIQDSLNVAAQPSRQAESITPYVFQYDSDTGMKERETAIAADKLVRWQLSPVKEERINENILGNTMIRGLVNRVELLQSEVLSPIIVLDETNDDANTAAAGAQVYIVQPVYNNVEQQRSDTTTAIVGYLTALVPWTTFFESIIPQGTAPMHLVLTNTCGQTATFQVNGPNVTVISMDTDVHDFNYDSFAIHSPFHTAATTPIIVPSEDSQFWCDYEFTIYPTEEFEDAANTDQMPEWYTLGVVLIFLFTSAVFVLYDIFVTKRQSKIEESAARSNAIVQSLFPAQVRDRLLQGQKLVDEQQQKSKAEQNAKKGKKQQQNGHLDRSDRNSEFSVAESSRYLQAGNTNVSLDDDENAITDKLLRTKPIADLFPNATVMFADICGFTAWSSVREPTQVFTLLEQIYNSFDILARKRRIFKVETIGDCYVAAAGLPDPRPDHATAMACFSNECLIKMHSVVKKLEVRLGPDTAELGMRFGLHSGPVTAGVLRGEKSRFQLFGDTVNTASRIETTGERNRVHLSEDTAKLIIEAGKETWVQQREGLVAAKGKGDMVTYWLTLSSSRFRRSKDKEKVAEPATASVSEDKSVGSTLGARRTSMGYASTNTDRKQRLIDWNVDVLTNFLKKIQAMREEEALNQESKSSVEDPSSTFDHMDTTVLDEVREIIALPQEEQVYKRDPQALKLDESVLVELKAYVGLIASMYQDNSFHNFEHASHVTQSVTKLLSRIVKADDIDYKDLQYKRKGNVSLLHKHTYGITSDPITQFACAFSALIHDVDHTGVPNAQLVKEGSEIAMFYRNKSVAEQNSVDLAWSLLMETEFAGLRSLIYRNTEELDRFRQLVVNSVMATDIADRELGAARKARWNKAFQVEGDGADSPSPLSVENPIDAVNRKATIVIEHLIQASDVSHTMQHWHVFTKWNEKLFLEMYSAFREGRAVVDPSQNWYKGEVGFFDFYIIPLAKKLKECGVFGVASDEYLNYAEANREEWERKGEAMVAKYLYSYEQTHAKNA